MTAMATPSDLTWHDIPDQPWPAMCTPAPDELADWLISLTREQLMFVLSQQMGTWEQESRCFTENHRRYIADLRVENERLRARIVAARAGQP